MARRPDSASDRQAPLVFFDLEATGLIQFGILPDIIQIAAVSPDDDVFDRYILPEKAMTASALRVTGLRVEGSRLLYKGREVPTVSLRDALNDFLDWLRKVSKAAGGRKPLLLAYNGTKFDVPVLRNAFNKSGLSTEAKETIGGFADVFQMALAKIRKGEVGNYRLETLARRFLTTSYEGHNAINDAKALKRVYDVRLAHVVDIMLYRSAYY